MEVSRIICRATRALFAVILLWFGCGLLGAQQQTPSKPGVSDLPPQSSVGTPAPTVGAGTPPVIGKQAIEQQDSAAAQLQRAAKAQEAARGRKGPRRLQLLHDAILYYSAVSYWWPAAKTELAMAAYRRGEIHRALQESGEARGAFEEVLEATLPADDLYIRALLELGHLDRREQRWSFAVARYQQAIACEKASLRFRNDAREWLVKVHLKTMAWHSVVVAADQWLSVCEGPAEEIRILDFQIRAKIGGRQLRQADQMLMDLRARMAVLAAAPSGEGTRVQSALDQMKAPAALDLARQNGR